MVLAVDRPYAGISPRSLVALGSTRLSRACHFSTLLVRAIAEDVASRMGPKLWTGRMQSETEERRMDPSFQIDNTVCRDGEGGSRDENIDRV